jgi:1-deoxy-D-xylulose-5-phosphate synthase
VPDLINALGHAKEQNVPVLIHVKTLKGQGYSHAQEDPITWHAVKPFNPENGIFQKSKQPVAPPTFTQVFSDTLVRLAQEDERIIGITAAMAEGTGLDKLRTTLPKSFFDVGICEQHAVTFAAGMACEGYKPVCAIYSTFLQRAYDQVIHDVCIQNLPVVFAIDRAGVVGNDGETHQGVFDIAYLRAIPNITLMAPANENELQHMLKTALDLGKPCGLRYPRGNAIGVECEKELRVLPIGKAEVLKKGHDILFIGLGPLVYEALRAAEILENQYNIKPTVVNARFIKPLDEELFIDLATKHSIICTIEDGSQIGGFGTAILELLSQKFLTNKIIKNFSIKDSFVSHGSQSEQLAWNGCTAEDICSFIYDCVLSKDLLSQPAAI